MQPPKPVKIVRPSLVDTFEYTIKGDDWELMIALPPDIDHFIMHNKDLLQKIHYAFADNPGYSDFISPDDRIAEETSPEEIWVKRDNNGSQPIVYIEIWSHKGKKAGKRSATEATQGAVGFPPA